MDSRYTKIVLRSVQVSARVGLAPWERETAQPLLVSVELYADAQDYLGRVTPSSIINYCPIYDVIRSWHVRPHTDLLETLVCDVLDACFAPLGVSACRVSVVKPEVLDQAQAAGVEAFMTRADYEVSRGGQLARARTASRQFSFESRV